MEYEILNSYELDIKQDIPAEMELLTSSNQELKNSNRSFTIILLTIGLGIVIYAVYQSSKTRKEDKDKY